MLLSNRRNKAFSICTMYMYKYIIYILYKQEKRDVVQQIMQTQHQ